MRIAVLGGTRFIGRAIVEELLRYGHSVAVIHRGLTGCRIFSSAVHVHSTRAELKRYQKDLGSFRAEVVIDVNGMTAGDVAAVAPLFPDCRRFVVISSCDVYQAYLGYRRNMLVHEGKVDECSPIREERRVLTHAVPDCPQYEKIEVEQAWRIFPAVILRPTAVYGPYDYLRREAFILDRLLAGRTRIPFGAGDLEYTRVSVTDLARCVRLAALSREELAGETFNVAETITMSIMGWAELIAESLGTSFQAVRVAEESLPPDLLITSMHRQHLIIDASKAKDALGWRPAAARSRVAQSVRWHAAQPPVRAGFEVDDLAMKG